MLATEEALREMEAQAPAAAAAAAAATKTVKGKAGKLTRSLKKKKLLKPKSKTGAKEGERMVEG